MNNELQELGAQISALRIDLTFTQNKFKEAISHKQKVEKEYNAEVERIKMEYQAAILKLNEGKEKVAADVRDIQNKMRSTEMEIEDKNALYAKLLQAQNEKEIYEELAKELAIICQDFEAYFQAHIYQHEDILFTIGAYDQGRNGILNANDLGLGKTFESIVSLYILSHKFTAEHNRKPRILWLTKKSLVKSTPREIRTWWKDSKVFTTETAKTLKDREFILDLYIMGGDIMLTNYETVRTTKRYAEIDWDLVVIDEVHKLKGGANANGATAIWTACKEVCSKARFVMMLSGTPMVNRPQEMWSYLHIFAPERFPSIKKFEDHFMEFKSLAGEFKLVVNPDKLLQGALKGQMIRRARHEVGLQLPELTREIRTLDMNPQQADIYKQMRENFFVWLDANQSTPLTATAIIAQLTRLRQINVWPAGIKITDPVTEKEMHLNIEDSSKIDEAMDIIDEAQDQVVIFSTFNEPLFEVQRRCKDRGLTCEVINGTTVSRMGEMEEAFQQKKLDVLCINSSMGEGLNLQKNPDRWPGGSSVAIFLDLWWSPARNEQCEGRVHRQGANQPVNIYILQNDRSVDAFIEAKLMDKKAQFDSIMESDEIRPASDWKDFLEGLV